MTTMKTAANDAAPKPTSATSGQLSTALSTRFVEWEHDRWVWEARYVRSLLAVDIGATVVATLVAFALRFHGARSANWYLTLSAVVPALWVGALTFSHGYERRRLFVGSAEFRLVLTAGVHLTAGMALLSYVFKADLARGYLLIGLVLTTQLSLLGRVLLRRRLHRARRDGRLMHRVLVLGHAPAIAEMTDELGRRRYHGFRVIGACLPADQLGGAAQVGDVPVLGAFGTAAGSAVAAGADVVTVLSCPELDGPMLRRLAWQLERDDIDLLVVPSLVDTAATRVTVRPVDGLPMMYVEHPRLIGTRRLLKGLFDVTAAALLLVLLAPVFLGIACWIRLGTGGPVFFSQTRVGRAGALFPMYRFRTVHVHGDRLADVVSAPDAGRLRAYSRARRLRRWSLDELPRLINVLLGQMSLVGPRPPLPAEVERYPQDRQRRLVVKPGMTGLWRASGRSSRSWADTIRLDLRYVDNWSFHTDLAILVRTACAVLRGSRV